MKLSAEGTDDVGVVLGTWTAGGQSTQQFLDALFRSGPSGAPALLFDSTVGNSAASLAGLEFKLRGPNVTVSHKEASGLAAIVTAVDHLREGRARAMMAGGVDAVYETFYKGHDRFDVMSREPHFSSSRWRRSTSAQRVRPRRGRFRSVDRDGAADGLTAARRDPRCRRVERRGARQSLARAQRRADADDAARARGRRSRSRRRRRRSMRRRMRRRPSIGPKRPPSTGSSADAPVVTSDEGCARRVRGGRQRGLRRGVSLRETSGKCRRSPGL